MLTTLPDHPQSSFANYHVSAFDNGDGTFTFPYKLEAGINKKVIALDLLAYEGFNPDILNYAYQHLDRIESLSEPDEKNTALLSFITQLRSTVKKESEKLNESAQ